MTQKSNLASQESSYVAMVKEMFVDKNGMDLVMSQIVTENHVYMDEIDEQKSNEASRESYYVDMVEEMFVDKNGMDLVMSQIVTEDPLGEFDDVDEIISQIDTDAIQQQVAVVENVKDFGVLDEMDGEIVDEKTIQKMEEEVNNDLVSDISAELMDQYQRAMDDILPNKSGNRYIQAYEVFKKWQASRGTASFDEKVMMAYFFEAGEKYKPSTLWSMYSMLKKTLICKENINIGKYCQLYAWLKKTADGFQSKQSNIFTPEEITEFVVKAPNFSYLGMKVQRTNFCD